MDNTLRRAVISATFARQDADDAFGPARELDAEGRAWRKKSLESAYRDYRDAALIGVGATVSDALRDAAANGRINLAEYDEDLEEARKALAHGGICDFVTTEHGVAILDTSALTTSTQVA
ncbi:hypothetical protein [Streptomyces filamentosus]|uniref:hypothetical protein n=1 Tax=Streptomyces filamentosus TaxID=67294 RepID=UPI0033FC68B5